MLQIPTQEPLSARAGDTWQWIRSLPDYPAPDWVLTYTFYSAAGVFSFQSVASGTDHLVSVDAATTAAYAAGRYDWSAAVTQGDERYSIGSGSLQVLPDVSAADSYDGRSHSRRMLDAITATLEGRATDGDLDVIKTATASHSTDFDPETLRKLYQQYAAAVAAEDAAQALARGDDTGRFIQVRFRG